MLTSYTIKHVSLKKKPTEISLEMLEVGMIFEFSSSKN